MAQWQFYGREREQARLRKLLQPEGPAFRAIGIVGRRGVGKTELFRQMTRDPDFRQPVLLFEIRGELSTEELRYRFRKAAIAADLEELLEEIPDASDSWPAFGIEHLIRHLLHSGVVVALDEFQNAEQHGLIGGIKLIIDNAQSVSSADRFPGRLVLMGSAQQQMNRILFGSQEPLYQRVEPVMRIQQWTPRSVFAMARDHGLLQDAGRFLTLWSAYGGVPGYWHRLRNEAMDPAGFLSGPDCGSWPSDFLDYEMERLRSSPEGHLDSWSRIELSDESRALLLAFADSPRGRALDRLRTG